MLIVVYLLEKSVPLVHFMLFYYTFDYFHSFHNGDWEFFDVYIQGHVFVVSFELIMVINNKIGFIQQFLGI